MIEKALSNPQFWGWTIQTIIIIAGFCIIKFNDLKHLTADVQDLSEEVKCNTKKLNKIDKNQAVNNQRITTLEGSKKK